MNNTIATDRDVFPRPRRVRRHEGVISFGASLRSVGSDGWPQGANAFQREFSRIVPKSKAHVAKRDETIPIRISRGASNRGVDGYRLRITAKVIDIEAADDAGARHAARTLAQLVTAHEGRIAAMSIDDWPDFAVRGVMLDISRDKIPTSKTLVALIDLFARLKMNQLQLYIEHTFAYKGHERVWRGTSALAGTEIESLDGLCRDRGIELVPNQNSLGHMEHWLRHAPYRDLAETHGPWQTPWGETRSKATTLCPIDPGSVRLMRSLYEQLLPHFSSRQLNVGGDEPWELGQGRSAAECARIGQGRVYLNYMTKIHAEVTRHKRRMQFWADWILKYPDLAVELPRDIVPLIWGYEADHPFVSQCRRIHAAGLEYYVCPGTSSWCSFAGRTTNMIENIRASAAMGRRHGAAGLLQTDWGDYGHRQQWPVSYGGFALAAAESWCGKSNAEIDPAVELDRHVFDGDARGAGALWLEAGRVHELSRTRIHNRSVFFELMNRPLETVANVPSLTRRRVERMRERVAELRKASRRARFGSEIVADEFELTLRVLDHACRRGLFAMNRRTATAKTLAKDMREIMASHAALWRKRNRPGGLRASLSYYQKNLSEYESAVK